MRVTVRPKALTQIEVMRVLAMAGIFLYHVWSGLPEAGTQPFVGPVIGRIFSQGHVGVLLFNMITGFVLTLPYAGPAGRPLPGYGTFLRHRWLRICPNYYVALLFWAAVAVVVGGASAQFGRSLLKHLLFVHTLDASVFFDIVPAYWWMGLIAQFYLLYPWLWRLYLRWGAAPATVFLCLAGWGGWLSLHLLARPLPGSFLALADYLLYFNLPYRLPEFALGMYCATLWQEAAGSSRLDSRGTALSLWIVFLVLVGLGLWGPSVALLLLLQLYWIAVCLSLGLALFCTRPAATLGAWPPMARAAAASYSFYLLHQPVIDYATPWARAVLAPFGAFVVVTIGAGVVSLGMSVLLDYAVARMQKATSGASR
jgi:peptidoglycan/LPS O-acetylase OafA/YrhL